MDLNKTFSELPEDTFCEIDEISLDSQTFPKLDFGNLSEISIDPDVVFNNNKRKFSDPESTIPSNSDITLHHLPPRHQN